MATPIITRLRRPIQRAERGFLTGGGGGAESARGWHRGGRFLVGHGDIVMDGLSRREELRHLCRRAATGPFSLIAAGITNNTYDYVVDTGMPAASNYFSIQAVTSNSISGNSAIVGALEGLTLVEEWNGMGLTSGSPTNGAAVSEWDGNFQGTAATANLANSPLLLLNATPAGAPAVHFNQAAQAELYVNGADSPVTGLSSFSELLVFRATLPGQARAFGTDDRTDQRGDRRHGQRLGRGMECQRSYLLRHWRSGDDR